MNAENPTFKLEEVCEEKTDDEPLPVKCPSFRSRFLARLTPLTALNRSVSVPHRSLAGSSISPKSTGEKWKGFEYGSFPVTPNNTTIPGSNAVSYYNFHSLENNPKPNNVQSSGFLRRVKSYRSANDSKKNPISSSLPEKDWSSCFDRIFHSERTATSHFEDPILTDLDSHLPEPLPPPRAYPPWLKIALQKQASVKSDVLAAGNSSANRHANMSDLSFGSAATLSPSFTCLQRQKSVSADGNRICPIIQNGTKCSDTHYWLIPPHRPWPSTLLDDKASTEGISLFNSGREYLNAPMEPKLRRNRSALTVDTANFFHGEKIRCLKLQVPKATDEECMVVLIGTNYNYDEALRRLILEIMCRQSVAPITQCKQLLQKHKWNLEKAMFEVTSTMNDGGLDAKPTRERRPQKLSTCSFNRQELLPSPLEMSSFSLPQRSKPDPTRFGTAGQATLATKPLNYDSAKPVSATSAGLCKFDATESNSLDKDETSF